MPRKLDLTDKVYGLLRVVKETDPVVVGQRKDPFTRWICECECGTQVVCYTQELRTGRRKDCGCKAYSKPHGNKSKDPQAVSLRALFNRTKNAAVHRGIAWSLTEEQYAELVFKPCEYCASEPFETFNPYVSKNGYTQRKFKNVSYGDYEIKFNGLDRVSSDIGYQADNVVPCCKWCNFAKNTRTVEEFAEWARKLVNNIENSLHFGHP